MRRPVPVRRRVRAPLPSLPCDRLACPTSASGQGGFGRRGYGASCCSRIGKLRENPLFSRTTRHCFFVLLHERREDREAFAQMTGIAILSVLPWGGSSIGRAPRSHRGGCEFDPHPLHFGSEGLPIGGPSSFCGLLSAFQGSAQTADRRSGAGSLSFAPHVHRCIARGLTFDLAFDAVGLVLRCCGPRFTRWWCCCRVIETWAPALAVCLEFRRGHHACGGASSPASACGHPRH